MPTLANITIKKHDGTTDIVYTGIKPGVLPSDPAIWQTILGTAVAHRPDLRYSVKPTGATTKDVRMSYQYPSLSTNSTTGITSVIARQKFVGIWTLDQSAPQVDVNEFSAQLARLIAHQTMIDALKNGLGWSSV